MESNKKKKIYTKDYFILIGIGFLPMLWKVSQIIFLSSFENALKILGQIALISILFKIFEESILNPLFNIFSKHNIKKDENRVFIAKKFLIFYSIATIFYSLIVLILTKQIMKVSHVPKYIFEETLTFLRIYIISSGVGVVVKYLYTFSLINNDKRKIFVYFLLRSVATTLLFAILVPNYTLSLGVNGIAISELMINIGTLIYFIITFQKAEQCDFNFNMKQYFKLFLFAIAETLVRNVVYYFVILVFLNKIDNQDLYFVSNEFIWSVMLVPTLAQSSLIKQDLANNEDAQLKPYFVNCIVLNLLIWFLVPIAFVVFKYIYCLTNYMDYFIVLLKLLPCYIIFVFDSVIESYFISKGKLHHIFIQSVFTNIFVYLTALVLYLCGLWAISLNSIILLFNLGVVISSIYTISVYLIDQKNNIRSQKHKNKRKNQDYCT